MIGEQVREAVRAGGLFARDRPVLAMLSGGRDSTCLLDVAVALLGAAAVSALHVNYGLRERADADERHCEALCEQLGVELEIVRTERSSTRRPLGAHTEDAHAAEQPAQAPPSGNLHAWARELRYGEAQRIAAARDALIATGHTQSDQVETILYRLAASPGRRALLGMVASDGRLIRPLLGVTREQTAAYCEARGLRVARGREQRRRALRTCARAQRAGAGAARGASGGGGQRAAHGVAAARGDGAARRSRRRGAGGPRRASRSRGCASCRRRSRGWSWCAWRRTRPAPTCRRREIAWGRSSRSALAAAAPSCTWGGRRAR